MNFDVPAGLGYWTLPLSAPLYTSNPGHICDNHLFVPPRLGIFPTFNRASQQFNLLAVLIFHTKLNSKCLNGQLIMDDILQNQNPTYHLFLQTPLSVTDTCVNKVSLKHICSFVNTMTHLQILFTSVVLKAKKHVI